MRSTEAITVLTLYHISMAGSRMSDTISSINGIPLLHGNFPDSAAADATLPAVVVCEKEDGTTHYIAALPQDMEPVGPMRIGNPVKEKARACVRAAVQKQLDDFVETGARFSTVSVVYLPDHVAEWGAKNWIQYIHFFIKKNESEL